MQETVLISLTREDLQSMIIDCVTSCLINNKQKKCPETEAGDTWFDLKELCSYLPDKPAKATVYGWVHEGTIPCHKGPKRLRFLKSEIDEFLKAGKKKTTSEIEEEANLYLKKKGNKA